MQIFKRNNLINQILLTVATVSMISCEDVPEFEEGDIVPVVEAFIYTNQNVDNILVKEVIPFGSPSTITQYISDLDVKIIWNENTYDLEEKEELPGRYHYSGEEMLPIHIGETYELRFTYENELVTAFTSVPEPPVGLGISRDELTIQPIEQQRDLVNFIQNGDYELIFGWDNTGGSYHYLIIENTESELDPIDVNNVINRNFQYTSSPTLEEEFSLIPFVHYSQYGRHRIVLFRVNEEYRLLYESLEQDSRDLNEPFSNITNGVGIFSAFATDTLYFDIVKP